MTYQEALKEAQRIALERGKPAYVLGPTEGSVYNKSFYASYTRWSVPAGIVWPPKDDPNLVEMITDRYDDDPSI